MATQPGRIGRGEWQRPSALMILQVALIALKLAGVIGVSWWWLLTPLWVGIAVQICLVVVFFSLYMVSRKDRDWIRRFK